MISRSGKGRERTWRREQCFTSCRTLKWGGGGGVLGGIRETEGGRMRGPQWRELGRRKTRDRKERAFLWPSERCLSFSPSRKEGHREVWTATKKGVLFFPWVASGNDVWGGKTSRIAWQRYQASEKVSGARHSEGLGMLNIAEQRRKIPIAHPTRTTLKEKSFRKIDRDLHRCRIGVPGGGGVVRLWRKGGARSDLPGESTQNAASRIGLGRWWGVRNIGHRKAPLLLGEASNVKMRGPRRP